MKKSIKHRKKLTLKKDSLTLKAKSRREHIPTLKAVILQTELRVDQIKKLNKGQKAKVSFMLGVMSN